MIHMSRKQDKRGFTLAELLIVVAIIAVLVGVSIPIFSNQLRKARFATNQANARAAEGAAIAAYLDTNRTGWNYDIKTGTVTPSIGALDRQTPHGMETRGKDPDTGVIVGWLTTDPSSWDVSKDRDSRGVQIRELGSRVYTRIGVDLNKDGSVQFYYFYKK